MKKYLMDLSKLVSSLKNDLRYEYNLLTKVGPVSRNKTGNDRTRYNVTLEFSGLKTSSGLPNSSKSYKVEVDFAILPAIVVGHVWCKNGIIQNTDLEREKHTFSFDFSESKEENIYSKAIHEKFSLSTKDEKNSHVELPIDEFPLTYRMLFSRCFFLKPKDSKSDYDTVIIPAYELVRFLFFKSQDLVSIVFNRTLTNHCEPGEFATDGEMGKIAVIATDKNYNEQELTVFANVFNCNDIRKTYEGVSSYLDKVLAYDKLKNKELKEGNNKIAELSTLFPKSHDEMHVCGIPISYNGTKSFYVYQIYSAAFKPDFNKVIAISGKSSKLNDANQGNPNGKKPREVLKTSTPDENILFNNKSSANAQSIPSKLEFEVDAIDIYGNNEIANNINIERVFQNKKDKKYVIVIHNKSGMFTLNTEKSLESQYALARIFSEKRNENQKDSFRPMLLKVLSNLYPRIYRKFYNYKEKKFSFEKNTDNPDKENPSLSSMVVKIFKGKNEKVLMDFSGIYNLRIVSFYREDSGSVSTEKVDAFINMVVENKRIPNFNAYLRYNVNKNNYVGYRWDRLNVGTIDEKELENKILELLPNLGQEQ